MPSQKKKYKINVTFMSDRSFNTFRRVFQPAGKCLWVVYIFTTSKILQKIQLLFLFLVHQLHHAGEPPPFITKLKIFGSLLLIINAAKDTWQEARWSSILLHRDQSDSACSRHYQNKCWRKIFYLNLHKYEESYSMAGEDLFF